jgi:hypothetical protein|uniref:hypothetical protein n=1 Tax=Saccharum barberi TaxID=152679 RepID=UPI0023F0436D|nr:hypothetical protein P4C77_pgp092 [Saccharum barberi]YP_010721405.1 hypothetical protein P4C73_pgp092 [Saccharum sinense]WJQ78230.1 hypothetical protein [Saccharum hybrid cultivar]WDS74494.1 hypothetical protein [Saccharum barberi]WDS74589.1 hypothetical protein [Saccharum barberi]WDS74683.1 hypothetical protein [Saccharum sinense]WJQ78324.1 hypothetical protein [Saccharum hybrid cultivar]
MARLKSRMFLVSAQALKLLTKIGAKKKKKVSILRIGTLFFYFRYYLICKYPFLNQWNVRIRDKFIYSVYSTFELIEKKKKFNEVKHCIENETYPFMIEIDFCCIICFLVLLVKKKRPSFLWLSENDLDL